MGPQEWAAAEELERQGEAAWSSGTLCQGCRPCNGSTGGLGTSVLEILAAGGAAGIAGQEAEDENPDEEKDDRINRDLESQHGSVLRETGGDRE